MYVRLMNFHHDVNLYELNFCLYQTFSQSKSKNHYNANVVKLHIQNAVLTLIDINTINYYNIMNNN